MIETSSVVHSDSEYQVMHEVASAARVAATTLRGSTAEQRTEAIRAMARGMRAAAPAIQEANARDTDAARAAGLTDAKLDRLRLDGDRIEAVAEGLDNVASLPDPVGAVVDHRIGPSGISVSRVRAPLGVILMIFEARPNVTAEAAALCLRAGNAVILRGGSEARFTNAAIGRVLEHALASAGMPTAAVQMINRPDHEAVGELLLLDQDIDLVIPRGGERLIRAVVEQSRIPVLKHYRGNCHVYVDESADLEMAARIAFNSKVQRPGVCNAMEHLLVHSAVAERLLPPLAARLHEAGVALRADRRAQSLMPAAVAATPEDWDEEYLDLILGVKVVDSADQAIAHINEHGSRHSDAIVTSDEKTAHRFLHEVDSASVLWNASTRLADGGEYGLGAEIGISTDKLHARGPMGAEELTCAKWVVVGSGQVRGAVS
jgi:glutamate-5-semialdehyde dehydrogenase